MSGKIAKFGARKKNLNFCKVHFTFTLEYNYNAKLNPSMNRFNKVTLISVSKLFLREIIMTVQRTLYMYHCNSRKTITLVDPD